MPFSSRGTSFGSIQTSLATRRPARIPTVLTVLIHFLFPFLKNSPLYAPYVSYRERAVNEKRYHARNKRGNAR